MAAWEKAIFITPWLLQSIARYLCSRLDNWSVYRGVDIMTVPPMERVPGDNKKILGSDGLPLKLKSSRSFKAHQLSGWYLAGCFWCIFCIGVAVGGVIVGGMPI